MLRRAAKELWNAVYLSCCKPSEYQLRVMLVHHIPKQLQERFRELLELLRSEFCFVDVSTFERLRAGDEPLRSNAALLTFDDGFLSQYRVAKEVLDPLGVRALFFIPTGFLEAGDRWREFVAHRISAGRVAVSSVADDLLPMSWEQAAELADSGHTIGSHTVSHARLTTVNDTDLERELFDSAQMIQGRIGVRPTHFAYPFGNRESLTALALRRALNSYGTVHSGVRGNNGFGVTRSPLVWRESINIEESPRIARGMFWGVFDSYYRQDREELRSWAGWGSLIGSQNMVEKVGSGRISR